VALQVVDDAKALLTPFLPHASQRVHELLGGTGTWASMPEVREVDEIDGAGGPSYPVLTGEHSAASATWGRVPIVPGTHLEPPTPLFAKLGPEVVDEELRRLDPDGGGGRDGA
jgi:methionyl-tRNA synthetase